MPGGNSVVIKTREHVYTCIESVSFLSMITLYAAEDLASRNVITYSFPVSKTYAYSLVVSTICEGRNQTNMLI